MTVEKVEALEDDAGIDFALTQLCAVLGVDTAAVCWDAATETLDGDVRSVIWSILRAKFGEDWTPDEALAALPGRAEAVKVTDWLAVAKAAGDHGVRYRTNRALEAFLAQIAPALATPPSPATVADGWVLVPKEPDDAMSEAAWDALQDGKEWGRQISGYDVWRAMLAVAPSQALENGHE